MSGQRHRDYDERGAMTNAPGPPSGPRWRCVCGGWNPATEPVCRFGDCDERRPVRGRVATLPDVAYDRHEREMLAVLAQRDAAYAAADALAAKVAAGRWIGEYSSENNPWQNALDLP